MTERASANRCAICMHQCKNDLQDCKNFKAGNTLQFYKRELKIQKKDINKICGKHNLKVKYMKRMLNGEICFNYKYRFYLNLELGLDNG